MKMMNGLAAIAVSICFTGLAHSEIADFYLADSGGGIYRVDGATLESNFVIQLDNTGFGINDILALDDGGILANISTQLVRFDLQTGEERIVFDAQDSFPDSNFNIMGGLAATSDGNVFFTTETISSGVVHDFGGLFNPITQEFTRLSDLQKPGGLYFDHHQIGENLFLGADWTSGRISIINALTGETEYINVDFNPVSFFESDGSIFALTTDGELYTFDPDTRASTLYGSIQGSSGGSGWIGAASLANPFILPSPGTLSLIGLAGLVSVRRRR